VHVYIQYISFMFASSCKHPIIRDWPTCQSLFVLS